MEREARFLEKLDIPLDCTGRGLKLRAKPTGGDLFFLHENPKYLPQTEQLRACIFLTRHHTFLLQPIIVTRQRYGKSVMTDRLRYDDCFVSSPEQ
jgi:hypothetical protein